VVHKDKDIIPVGDARMSGIEVNLPCYVAALALHVADH
jgi:hypothetical protein